ncbi:MAG: peptidoglycan-binding domain-containing protein [Patescibacteria group bacterium]
MLKKSKITKVIAGLTGFAMVLSISLAPVSAGAATIEELTAQINSLLSTIAGLQSQLSTLSGTTGGTSYTFTTNLTLGSTGADVMNLQKVLNSSSDTQVAATGVGSKGNESSTFGPLTKAAVIKFQTKNAISPAVGYVGPITRAKLNTMGGVVVVPPTPTGSATVSTTVQPSASLAVSGASRVPFTKFVVTAGASDVTINSVVVERAGLAQDAVLSGVILLDDQGIQLGIAKSLNSNHQATIGEAVVVKAGTSKTFTVAGNTTDITSMASYAGEVIGLKVVAVNSSSTISGSLPITGAYHVTNATISIGTATFAVSSFDPNSALSKPVGTVDYKFAGVRVTAGSAEKIRLWSVRWNQAGSIAATDLANVKVYIDGVAYTPAVSADGKYFTVTVPSGLVIDKGFSKDIYIQGDIVGTNAATRTIQFDIEKDTDVYVSGETYGYGIKGTNPNSTTNTAASTASEFVGPAATPGTPFFSGSTVTVTAGSATTIAKSNTVPSQNIAVNVPNQILGGYETNFTGEGITVASTRFAFATSSGVSAGGAMTDVTLVDENGAVVAGPVNATLATTYGGSQYVTFTDSITYPLGKHIFTLKGKLPTTYANNGTITASTTPAAWTTVKGVTTGSTVTLTGVAFSMNAMTVKTASLAVSVGSTPSAQNIPAGIQGFTFANYQFDASASGEDVRFSSIPLLMDVTTMTTGEVNACQLFDGATALNNGSNVLNAPTDAANTTLTFDQQYTVPKGTVKTLALKCNISTSVSALDTITWGITAGASMTVTGVTSGADVSETVSGSTGQLMTVATGTFTVVLDTGSPGYTIVSAGSIGTTLGVLKLLATNEELTLKELTLQLTSTASSTNADFVGNTVTIWDGGTQVGSAVFQGSNTQATSTLSLILPKDTDKLLTIKADLSPVGVSQPGTVGALIKVDYDGGCVSCTRVLSATTGFINSSSASDTAVNGVRVFKSYPTFAKLAVPSTSLVTGTTADLYRFSVKAASTGSIGIYQFTVNVATSATPASASTTVTNLKINAYTDSLFSSPVNGFNPAGQLNDTLTALITGNNTITFTASTQTQDYLQIPAGETYYFRVVGDITLVGSPTGASVVTNIQGDAAYPLVPESTTFQMASTTNTTAFATHDDFIWSPNSTTTSTTAGNAWTNGYFVPGLGADNMDAVTLTK